MNCTRVYGQQKFNMMRQMAELTRTCSLAMATSDLASASALFVNWSSSSCRSFSSEPSTQQYKHNYHTQSR